MTFEEYLKKRLEVDQCILEELKDDKSDDFAYQISCLMNGNDLYSNTTKLYKKYSNIELCMQDDKEFCKITNFDDGNLEDCIWWKIQKYVLTDGEYQKYMECTLSASGELIHFFIYNGYLEEFFKAENTVNVLGCRNVDVPYRTGDILKVKNQPLGDDFYIIYCYDETKAGNKHLQLSLNDEISFFELNWLHKTEKVEKSPVYRINEMSKKIKENPELFKELLEKHGVSPF